MKIFFQTAIQNVICILLTAGLLFSCGQMDPFESREIKDLFDKAISAAPDCNSDCIEKGSGKTFEKTGFLSERSGNNTKVVSYSAYNTEDAFMVEVTYLITTGPTRGKASITINIAGEKKEFADIPSGRTVSHTIPLPEGWNGCDEMSFQISQTGMGKPINFSEKYELVPVCPEEEEIEYVVMGNQIWSKYNLNVDRYRNGDPIPEIQDDDAWLEATTGAWCYFNNDPANGELYGRLYNYAAITDPRNLAPEGWRIPTEDDWTELFDYLGTPNWTTEYRERLQPWNPQFSGGRAMAAYGLTWYSVGYWWSIKQNPIDDYILGYAYVPHQKAGLALYIWRSRVTDGLSVRFIKE